MRYVNSRTGMSDVNDTCHNNIERYKLENEILCSCGTENPPSEKNCFQMIKIYGSKDK